MEWLCKISKSQVIENTHILNWYNIYVCLGIPNFCEHYTNFSLVMNIYGVMNSPSPFLISQSYTVLAG